MSESFIITDPAVIELMRWITVRSALKLEIKTGMKRSNQGRTTLQLANEITGQPTRDKRKAHGLLNAMIVEAGGQDRPL